MSAALDDDTRRALDEGRETAGAMLRAAQKDLQKVFIVFLVGFIGTFYALRLYVWDVLKSVTEADMNAFTRGQVEFIAQTPFDVILIQAKIGLIVGVVVAVPAFLYFARDALRARDLWPSVPVARWKLIPLLGLSALLFVLGVAYSYSVLFPLLFNFFAGNALSTGFVPRYSIVKWAQFILLLTMTFGFAAQLPLIMTVLAYVGVVPYETFRDYWRHAVLGITIIASIVNGSPDPFSMSIVAIPLIVLYGIGLVLAKAASTARLGREQLNLVSIARERWNVVGGGAVAGGAGAYLFAARGGVAAVNRSLARVGLGWRLPGVESLLPLSTPASVALFAVFGGVVLGLAVFAYVAYVEIEQVPAGAGATGRVGDPTAIDLGELDAAGVRAAPEQIFEALDEDEAVRYASEAMDAGDPEKAQAVLDRFDAAHADSGGGGDAAAGGTEGDSMPGLADDVGDRAARASETFLTELGEEDAEEEVGGYYRDVMFILDSLTSKSFRVVGVFMVVLVGMFTWLYRGGIKDVKQDFLSRLPTQVRPEEMTVIALHPVEALIFEMKFSTLVAVFATLPVIAYYAWPALRERGFVRGRRRVIFGWVGALVLGLVGGFVFGYTYVAPTVISFLVADAVQANMVISYRISDFFWLIFYTTAGIGILVDVPVFMLLLNRAGVSYRTMRSRWREVTVGVMAFAAFFTPATALSMILVTVPLMAAYGVGLVVLFVVTLGGRRDRGRVRGAPGA